MNACHLEKVLQRIANSVKKFQRNKVNIRLIAVSKTRSASAIIQAYEKGQRDFGESYVQEAVEKIDNLHEKDISWHFIGPIQSNKTKAISSHFDWVQSVDRLKIARRLSTQRPENLPPLNICIQVNISEDPAKSGILPTELDKLALEILALPNLKLRGIMVIPKKETDFDKQRTTFAKARECFEKLRTIAPTIDTLSMGMSADMEAAIAENSTMVRIGTDIFGPREQK